VAKFRFLAWLWDWLLSIDAFAFEWDEGNATKSFQKHCVTCAEAEQVFTEGRFIPLGQQFEPPVQEPRFAVLGEGADGKPLFVAFALRNDAIRVISARPMSQKEREFYASIRQE
jgi:hypothetical protein